MMRIALKVTYADGREQAVMVSAPDLIGFERSYDKPMTVIGTGRIEYLWWVAWHATKRKALTDLDFEAWIETVDTVADDPNGGAEIAPLETRPDIG